MKNIPVELYKKIEQVSKEVKKDLFRKGIIVPVKNKDGSIRVGKFRIVKNDNGCYSIRNFANDVVVDNINLPQTAAVVANGLALGKFKDDKLIDADQNYGYAMFDEMIHKRAVERSKNKSLEHFELMMTKCTIAKARKEYYKSDVVRSFQKLVNLI
jgi:hypothetical protein